MSYYKIRKKITVKACLTKEKNIAKETLLDNSGLSGEEKDDLAALIDLGMSIEKGNNLNISYSQMIKVMAKIEEINNIV